MKLIFEQGRTVLGIYVSLNLMEVQWLCGSNLVHILVQLSRTSICRCRTFRFKEAVKKFRRRRLQNTRRSTVSRFQFVVPTVEGADYWMMVCNGDDGRDIRLRPRRIWVQINVKALS
ncbi:hypothetical protein LINPERPRIM_LOCUS14622 [Linum perenne]